MAILVPVTDPGDDRLADYTRLKDGALLREDTFLCESALVIRRAIELGVTLRSLLLTPAKHEALAPVLADVDAPVFLVEKEVMNGVTGFKIHRGAVAAAVPPIPPPLAQLLASTDTVAVLEAVSDHENLGALFRNAAAFGVGAVLLDPSTADPLYRRAVRVSLGHVLAVPHRRVDDLRAVRDAGFEVVALTPDPTAEPVDVLAGIDKVALLLGAEGPGLTAAALAGADRRVRIPMAAGVDSLNVATAAAIAFHHRHRG